jgi:tRNA threonylcarbamoyladenosine biosynthesis protein TsaB
MLILALDTALPATTVVVARDGSLLASRSEPMERGHQERAAVLVAEAMGEAGAAFSALDRIGVTLGPGSFTGVRVGLALAKGLAMAWDTPLVGLSSLEALAASVGAPGVTAVAVDARRERVYLQVFENGAALCKPDVVQINEAFRRVHALQADPRGAPLTVVGSGAPLFAHVFPAARIEPIAYPAATALGRLTASAGPSSTPLRPLYLRPPDAKTLAERGVEAPARTMGG